MAAVVRAGCDAFDLPRDRTLPLGVTFSFPMEQTSLAEARLMSMGKGFAVSADLDLGSRLLAGYDLARADTDSPLPPLRVAAIANDSVSTLVSFIVGYDDAAGAEHDVDGQHQRACMGLILGTGCNATIPLPLSRLHPSKRPPSVSVLPGEAASSRVADLAVAVNTEWSINGTAPPLRELGLVTRWDRLLDERGEAPGFQPLEYMTAGRYLGELGRLMLVDYLVDVVGVDPASLPARLRDTRHAVSTTFLSHFRPPADLQEALRREFSLMDTADAAWCPDAAAALYHIAKAIEVRAAGIVAAATVALLVLGGELPASDEDDVPGHVLGVGYTGGCIVHFQDYLVDCQAFIDELVARRYAARARRGEALPRVVLSPCHDGGIVGAGILVAAAMGSERAVV